MRASAARPRNSTPSPCSTVKGTCQGAAGPQSRNESPLHSPLQPLICKTPSGKARPRQDKSLLHGNSTRQQPYRKALALPGAQGSTTDRLPSLQRPRSRMPTKLCLSNVKCSSWAHGLKFSVHFPDCGGSGQALEK